MSDDTAAAGIIAQAIARLTTITSANSGGGGGVSTIGPTTPTTLTLGSVVFAGASTLAQDNANLFWDATNHVLSTTKLTVTAAPTFSAMTLGSVLFAGTAGLLSQDNAKLFWDATNHRLGIGTTAPGEFLDVAGNITLNHFSAGATVDRRVGIGTTGGTVTGAIHWAGVQFAESSSNDQTLHFWTSADGGAATEKMMIDKSGSVGIGTTAPTSPLQVVTLPTYTSNATAAAGGLTAGAFFKVSVAGEYFVHVVV